MSISVCLQWHTIGDIKEMFTPDMCPVTSILNFVEQANFLYLQLFCHVYFCYILLIEVFLFLSVSFSGRTFSSTAFPFSTKSLQMR